MSQFATYNGPNQAVVFGDVTLRQGVATEVEDDVAETLEASEYDVVLSDEAPEPESEPEGEAEPVQVPDEANEEPNDDEATDDGEPPEDAAA